MGKYRDHREPRRRRADEEPNSLSEQVPEPSYFQRSAARSAEPQNAEVLWFNNDKGFGFVKLADGTEAYLHARVVEAAGRRDVSEGMTLKVIVDYSPRGRQISQLLELDDTTRKGPARPLQSAEAATGGFGMPGEVEGTVKWYNPDKGFGFIAPSDGGKDVFVHATALGRSGVTIMTEGQTVLIECGAGKKGQEVRSILVV